MLAHQCRRAITIQEDVFRLSDYRAFLADNANSISDFQAKRQAAFDTERADWEARGEFSRVAELVAEADTAIVTADEVDLPAGSQLVETPFGGMILSLGIGEGDRIKAGQQVAIIEAMKMESPVRSPFGGLVRRVYVSERKLVTPGAPLFAIEPDA